MDERSRNNNTGTEVPRKEVDAEWDLPARNPLRNDREKGNDSGNKADHKDGRDPRAQVAIVVIPRYGIPTDDIFLADLGEVDVVRVEI